MQRSWGQGFQGREIPVWNTNVMINQGTFDPPVHHWNRSRPFYQRGPFSGRDRNQYSRSINNSREGHYPQHNRERSQSVPRELSTSDLRDNSYQRYNKDNYNEQRRFGDHYCHNYFNRYRRDDVRKIMNRKRYGSRDDSSGYFDRDYHCDQDYSRNNHQRFDRKFHREGTPLQNRNHSRNDNEREEQSKQLKLTTPEKVTSTCVRKIDIHSISPSEKIDIPKLFGGFQPHPVVTGPHEKKTASTTKTPTNDSNQSRITNDTPVHMGTGNSLSNKDHASGSNNRIGSLFMRSLEENESNNNKQMLKTNEIDKTVYTLSTLPPFDGNIAVGGDRIKAKVIYVCEYCDLFTYDNFIEKHIKTRYHYNKVKEYLTKESEKEKLPLSSTTNNVPGNQTLPPKECFNLPQENNNNSVNTSKFPEGNQTLPPKERFNLPQESNDSANKLPEEIESRFSEDEDSPSSSIGEEAMEIDGETNQSFRSNNSKGPLGLCNSYYDINGDELELDYT